MKLVYLAPSDIQVARVDRQCIVYFCAALDRIAVEVELVAMRIRPLATEPQTEDPLALYRVRNSFPLKLRRVPVTQKSKARWIAINRLVVHVFEAGRLAFSKNEHGPLVFYTKNYGSAGAALALRRLAPSHPSVVFEAHLPPRNALQRLVLSHANLVVANSFALGRELLARGDVGRNRILPTHQGVDLEFLDELRVSKEEARRQVGLPLDKKLVIYTGKTYVGYREIDYLLEAARALEGRSDILFVIVGGRADHVAELRKRIRDEHRGNVELVGFVPPAEVHNYQFAADVLTMYYPAGMELNDFRSPGKLFEYMAASRPIVAVDLPVLREVLGEPPAAVLVPPNNPALLAEEIDNILRDPERAERLASHALRKVASFSWSERARSVVRSIEATKADTANGPVRLKDRLR